MRICSGWADCLKPVTVESCTQATGGYVTCPRSADDDEWMPLVAERGLVVITRDQHTRTRPVEMGGMATPPCPGLRALWPRESVAAGEP
jgi:PIN like domain